MDPVRYHLKNSLKYAVKGDHLSAEFVEMRPPTYRQIDKVAPLKQALMSAILDVRDNKTDDDGAKKGNEEKIDGATYILLLYQGKGDIARIMSNARNLILSGVFLVDGETSITQPILDDISVDDFEGLLGEYIVNFLAPSLMGGR